MKTVDIKIFRPEPKYDIQYYADKVARRVIDEDHPEQRFDLQVSDDAEDWTFERFYQEAIAKIGMSTKYYVKYIVDSDPDPDETETIPTPGSTTDTEPEDTTTNDKIESIPDRYILTFRLPEPVNGSFEQILAIHIHNYLTYYSLSQWFVMAWPAEAAPCQAKAEESLKGLVALFTNVPPRKRWYNETQSF